MTVLNPLQHRVKALEVQIANYYLTTALYNSHVIDVIRSYNNNMLYNVIWLSKTVILRALLIMDADACMRTCTQGARLDGL
jgi:hypothetical protein